MNDDILDTLISIVVVWVGVFLSYITYKRMIRKERNG